jgi:hypothetical protein
MREAEGQFVREYGGRPRPILTREERDFIRQNRDAPVDGGTREQEQEKERTPERRR